MTSTTVRTEQSQTVRTARGARPRLLRAAVGAAVLLFWLIVWQICAMAVGRAVVLPTPLAVGARFLVLARTAGFWQALSGSLARVTAGYLLGALGGITVGFLMFFVRPVRTLLSPLLTVIRSTPVASFIILTLVMMKNTHIPTFITFLMVFPMLAGAACTALGETDRTLIEAAEVYRVRGYARLCAVYLPSAAPVLRAQALTALGFAWKAGVAAEVLCYPARSIGLYLHDAKAHLETTDLFAYTLLVILVSLALEKALRFLLLRGGAKK